MTVLKNVLIQSAVGVGGGSLIYGNGLYEPLEQFYNDPANHGDGVLVWRGVGAARLVLSVVAGGPIGFAWPLASHSPLGTEQRPGVAATGAVEDALDDRWPLR